MTDRELLELAAKAFWGDEVDDCCSIRWLEDEQAIGYTHADNQDHNGEDREFVWNPLTDDGDALRLAVRLNLHVGIDAESAGAITVEWDFDEGGIAKSEVVEFAPINGDDFSATRRAIVRAAAEIGRAMP